HSSPHTHVAAATLHAFPTRRSSDLNGWRKLGELGEGDHVATARMLPALGQGRWPRLSASHIYWDRVTSIEPVGVRETYDLRIDEDRKSTRLNSSHQIISYAVFVLK